LNALLTTDELAERWSMKPNTLRNWRYYGKGPKFIRLGTRGSPVRYSMEDVRTWEQKHRVKSNSPRTTSRQTSGIRTARRKRS
jgi:hypothetical protein